MSCQKCSRLLKPKTPSSLSKALAHFLVQKIHLKSIFKEQTAGPDLVSLNARLELSSAEGGNNEERFPAQLFFNETRKIFNWRNASSPLDQGPLENIVGCQPVFTHSPKESCLTHMNFPSRMADPSAIFT